jgi:hypothetical protein
MADLRMPSEEATRVAAAKTMLDGAIVVYDGLLMIGNQEALAQQRNEIHARMDAMLDAKELLTKAFLAKMRGK